MIDIESSYEFTPHSHDPTKRDLDGLPEPRWRDGVTEWIYALRKRTHALDNLVTKALADLDSIRKDATRSEQSLQDINSTMRQVRDEAVEMRAVIGFLKWALPISVAASGVLMAVVAKIAQR